MKKLIIPFMTIVLIGLLSIAASAQDPHLSQWSSAPLITNAAETGNIDGTSMRIGANYRSQWGVLGSNITTTALSFDMKRERLGIGGYILNNNLADVMNNISFVPSVSYEITDPKNRKYHIVAGAQIGFIYKRLNPNNLTFDNQYEDGNFDGDLPSGEQFIRTARFMPETSFGGLYYNSNKRKLFKPYAGFSISHITAPKENFLEGDDSRLPRRYMVYAGGKIKTKAPFDMTPYAMFMMQGSAREIVGGMSFDYEFDYGGYHALLDLGYRHNDAIIVQTGFKIKDNWYRISYDINVSPLREFTRGRNALEFSATFTPQGRFFL